MQMNRRLCRAAVCILTALLVCLAPVAVRADDSYDFDYEGQYTEGHNIGAYATVLFELGRGEETARAYCVDMETYIVNPHAYQRVAISDSALSETAALRLKTVLLGGYPAVPLDTLKTLAGCAELTKKDAIAATQAAVWNAAVGASFTLVKDTPAEALYQYLTALPDDASELAKTASLELSITHERLADGCRIDIAYRAVGKNADGSTIPVTLGFGTDPTASYGALVTVGERDADGFMHTIVGKLPDGAEMTISLTAVQQRGTDGCIYLPEGGGTTSQTLAGLYTVEEKLRLTEDYVCACTGALILNLTDAETQAPVAGAVYELAADAAFTEPVELTTDVKGSVTAENLAFGDWYVREKTPANGYTADATVHKVTLCLTEPEVLDLVSVPKHYPCTLHIYDLDAADKKQLAGAVFAVYADEACTTELACVTTLLDGPARVENLPAGTYFVCQITPPDGYLADALKQKMTLSEMETGILIFENSRNVPTAAQYGRVFAIGGVLMLLALCGWGIYLLLRYGCAR